MWSFFSTNSSKLIGFDVQFSHVRFNLSRTKYGESRPKKQKCLDLSLFHFRVLIFVIIVFSRAYFCHYSISDCLFLSFNFRTA